MRPFLKYAGGKRHAIDTLLSVLPDRIDGTYYEPFLGGGAIFFALRAAGRLHGPVFLSDANEEIVNAYQCVRDDVESVVLRLSYKGTTGYDYYTARSNVPRDPIDRAVRTIYLNRTCFNGLYRVNSSGEFNVPWGKRENVDVVRADVLHAASAALQDVEVECLDWADTLAAVPPEAGDVVYLDPPYLGTFDGYTSTRFGEEQHARLAQNVAIDVQAGAFVVAHVGDCPVMRRLYAPYEGTTIEIERPGRVAGGKRQSAGELIVIGVEQ